MTATTTSEPEAAILRTLLYADIFDYPLTLQELHHYLIAAALPREAVQAAIEGSPWLAERVTRVNGYLTVHSREALSEVRDARRQSSAALWRVARRWAYWLGCLPFVRMVAVTGALAMDNAPAGDDVDYLIVTAPGRVWLARALAVAVVRLARLVGDGLCPNYVLAQTALAQHKRDLFVAHDLAQMVPLVGRAVYAEMRAANAWALDYLPQARAPLRAEPELAPRSWAARLKALGEWVLGGRLGDALEAWERRRKLRKFAALANRPGSAAELDAERVKGHFDDHRQPVLAEFEARVARYLGLEEAG